MVSTDDAQLEQPLQKLSVFTQLAPPHVAERGIENSIFGPFLSIRMWLPFVGLLLLSFSANAQTLLHTEDFEDDGNGTDYRANEFDDSNISGGNDVWTRSENSNNGPNGNTSHTYSGYVGLDWWCGEDIDAPDNPFGSGSPGYLMLKTLDVSAYQGDSIQVKVYLAGNTGTIKRYRENDYLRLQYAFNGDIATGANTVGAIPTQANLVTGTYTIFAAFYGSGTTTANSSALIQDLDLDGVSEGSQGPADSLKLQFAEWTFSFPIGNSDTTVSILFEGITSGGSEEIGIDHIRVFRIAGSSPLSASISGEVNPACNGESSGSATVQASGGASPYSYAWSNGGTSATASGLPAGSHTVTVTDNSGSTATATATLTEPGALAASLTITGTLACNGDADGEITALASGGVSPYSYSWSSGATSAVASNLSAGTFTVTVTDANSCTHTGSVTLSQPSALTVSVLASNVTCTGDGNGGVTSTVLGGSSTYTYSWSNGASTQNLSGLGGGTYTLTVTDGNGCTNQATGMVAEAGALLSVSATASGATCNGGADGSVSLSVSGGQAAFSYVWSNGATTQNLTAVGANSYTVTVSDSYGCQKTTSATVSEPTVLSGGNVSTN